MSQGTGAIAIGYQAGLTQQRQDAIAIGTNAGQTNQGTNAIAIGNNAVAAGQVANSIAINASGTAINANQSGFFMDPIRGLGIGTTSTQGYLCYLPATKEIVYNNGAAKNFIIDHPLDKDKYLIHACLEGPESGVYYRGEGKIRNDKFTIIHLPDYVDKLATHLTVQITPIYSEFYTLTSQLYTSRVQNNSFTVYGTNCDFFWLVHGKRSDIDVEPNKQDIIVKGDGPYTWIGGYRKK